MIPPTSLVHWRTKTPWGPDAQIEQYLVLTKAVIQLHSDPHPTDARSAAKATDLKEPPKP